MKSDREFLDGIYAKAKNDCVVCPIPKRKHTVSKYVAAACVLLCLGIFYAVSPRQSDHTPMPMSRTSQLWVAVENQGQAVVVTKNYTGLPVEESLLQSIKSQLPEKTKAVAKIENQQVTLYFETKSGVYQSADGQEITADQLLKETT